MSTHGGPSGASRHEFLGQAMICIIEWSWIAMCWIYKTYSFRWYGWFDIIPWYLVKEKLLMWGSGVLAQHYPNIVSCFRAFLLHQSEMIGSTSNWLFWINQSKNITSVGTINIHKPYIHVYYKTYSCVLLHFLTQLIICHDTTKMTNHYDVNPCFVNLTLSSYIQYILIWLDKLWFYYHQSNTGLWPQNWRFWPSIETTLNQRLMSDVHFINGISPSVDDW